MLNSEKSSKIPTKTSPQMLDEMDNNIHAAAESARRAEEAARLAREAAIAATKASALAEKRAEEAIKAGEKAAETATRAAARVSKKADKVDISETGARKYLVIFEKAGKNYSAYSPDIPGCIATGKTRGETEKNIREAISFHLEGMQKDGLKLPASSSFTEYVEV